MQYTKFASFESSIVFGIETRVSLYLPHHQVVLHMIWPLLRLQLIKTALADATFVPQLVGRARVGNGSAHCWKRVGKNGIEKMQSIRSVHEGSKQFYVVPWEGVQRRCSIMFSFRNV